MANLQASLILSLVDKVTAPARGVQKAIGDVQEQLERNTAAIRETQGRLFGATAVFAGFAAALAGPIKMAGDFEAQMNRVEAALSGQTFSIEAMTEKAKELGETTQFSASQAAEGIEILAKNGVTAADILGGALDASLTLAAASGSDLGAAADVATDVMLNFGKTAEDLKGVVDGVSGVLLASKFGFDDYRLAIGQAGGVAGGFGVELEEFNAVIAATSSSFASGSDAGTSFKTFLQTLTPNSKPAAEAMKRLGMEFFDAQGNMKSMADIAQELREGVAGLSEEARNDALKTIFGTDAIRTALALAREGSEGISELTESIASASAQEQAEARMKGLNGMLKEMKSVAEGVAIAFGDTLLPSLTEFGKEAIPVIRAVSQWVRENEELTRRIVAVTAALLGMRVALLGLKLLGLTGKQGILMAIAAGLNTVGRAASRMKAATTEAIALQKSLASLSAMPVGLTPLQRMTRDVEKTPLSKMDKLKATLRAIAGVTGLSVVATGIGSIVGALTGISLLTLGGVTLAVAAVAGAGLLIVKNWDRVTSIVKGVAGALADNFGPAIEFAVKDAEQFEEIAREVKAAIGWVMDGARSIASDVMSIFSGGFFERNVLSEDEKSTLEERARAMTQTIIDAINAIPGKVMESGGKIIQAIWDSMSERMKGFVEWIRTIPSQIMSALPGGEEAVRANNEARGGGAQGRAVGGPIFPGRPYMVGERGPEGIFPSQAAYVATTRQVQALASMARRVPSPVSLGSRNDGRNAPANVNVSFGDIVIPGGSNASAEELSQAFGRQIAGRLRSAYGDFA